MRTAKLTKTESLFEICKRIQRTNPEGKTRKGTSVVDGIVPQQAPTKPGYFQFTPEQLLTVLIEPAHYDVEAGEMKGYQRGLSTERCRRIARDLLKGKLVHPPILGLENGRLFGVDGKHRMISAVIAHRPMWCVVEAMTADKRAELYSDQSFQVKQSRDNLIFSKQNALAKYCLAAIEAKEKGTDHAWRGLIDIQATKDSLSLGTAYALIGTYCLERLSGGSGRLSSEQDEVINKGFKKSDADQLAELIRVFGTKKTNPVAYDKQNIHALVDMATLIKRRQGMTPSNIARWSKIMPSFNFDSFKHLTKRSSDMRHFLILHWNKRLAPANKIREEE